MGNIVPQNSTNGDQPPGREKLQVPEFSNSIQEKKWWFNQVRNEGIPVFEDAPDHLKRDEDFVFETLKTIHRDGFEQRNIVSRVVSFFRGGIDRDFALKCCEQFGWDLVEHFKFRDDEQFALDVINKSYKGKAIQFISERLRNNEKVMELGVAKWYGNLQVASKRLRGDKAFVLKSVEQKGALQYASERLRDEKEVVVKSVEKWGRDLQYASERLRDDKDVVLRGVGSYGQSLEFVSERLRDDKDVVLRSFENDGYPWALKFSSGRLRNDQEVVIKSIKKSGESVNYIGEKMWDDEEVAAVILESIDGIWPIERMSVRLRNKKEFMLKAVKEYNKARAVNYAGGRLLDDKDFVLECVEGIDFENISNRLQSDKDVVYASVSHNGHALCYVDNSFKNDVDLVFIAIENSCNGSAIEYASEKLRDNAEIVLKSVKEYGNNLKYASKRLRTDKSFVLKCLEIGDAKDVNEKMSFKTKKGVASSYSSPVYCGVLENAAESLRDDKEVVLKSLERYDSSIMFASERLKGDKEVMLKSVEKDGGTLQFASEGLRDNKEIVLKAVENSFRNYGIGWASERLRRYDKDVVLKMVEFNGKRIKEVCDDLRGDADIVEMAVLSSGREAWQHASEKLHSNEDFRLRMEKLIYNDGLKLKKRLERAIGWGSSPLRNIKIQKKIGGEEFEKLISRSKSAHGANSCVFLVRVELPIPYGRRYETEGVNVVLKLIHRFGNEKVTEKEFARIEKENKICEVENDHIMNPYSQFIDNIRNNVDLSIELEDLEISPETVFLLFPLADMDVSHYIEKKKNENEFPLEELEILRILSQLLDGFSALFKHGIVHADAKPDNFLINKGVHVVITDF